MEQSNNSLPQTPNPSETKKLPKWAWPLIVVGAMAFTALGFWLAKNSYLQENKTETSAPDATSTSPASTASPTDPYSGWKTYTNSEMGFSIKYPDGWGVRVKRDADPLELNIFEGTWDSDAPDLELVVNNAGFGIHTSPEITYNIGWVNNAIQVSNRTITKPVDDGSGPSQEEISKGFIDFETENMPEGLKIGENTYLFLGWDIVNATDEETVLNIIKSLKVTK